MSINIKNQLALVNYQTTTNDWVINLLNKGIILDKNCVILEGLEILVTKKVLKTF